MGTFQQERIKSIIAVIGEKIKKEGRYQEVKNVINVNWNNEAELKKFIDTLESEYNKEQEKQVRVELEKGKQRETSLKKLVSKVKAVKITEEKQTVQVTDSEDVEVNVDIEIITRNTNLGLTQYTIKLSESDLIVVQNIIVNLMLTNGDKFDKHAVQILLRGPPKGRFNGGFNVNIPEFYVELDDDESFKYMFDRFQNAVMKVKGKYDDSELVEITEIIIVTYKDYRGGCISEYFCRSTQGIPESTFFNSRAKDNNCLFDCLNVATGLDYRFNDLRKQLNLEKGSLVTLNDEIAKIYGKKINLFRCVEHKGTGAFKIGKALKNSGEFRFVEAFGNTVAEKKKIIERRKLIAEIEDKLSKENNEKMAFALEMQIQQLEDIRDIVDYNSGINILWYNRHFMLIKTKQFLEYKRCGSCGFWMNNLEEHVKQCAFCIKCKRSFQNAHSEISWVKIDPEDTSDKPACVMVQTIYKYGIEPKEILEHECKERKVVKPGNFLSVLEADKEYYSKDYTIHADFETCQFEGDKEHTVYAARYKFPGGATETIYGKNCLDRFLDAVINRLAILKEENPKGKYAFNFYNGSGFDAIFILKRLRQRNEEVKKLIIKGGYVYTFTFMDGFVKMFDLCKFTMSPLAKACEDYGLRKEDSKGDFDHTLIKRWSDVEKYKYDSADGKQKGWYNYLEKDVESLSLIFNNFSDFCWDNFKLNPTKFISLSSLAMHIFRTMMDPKVQVQIPTFAQDTYIRESIYGGRCYPSRQLFISAEIEKFYRGEITYVQILDFLIDNDVVSLYPTAMCSEVNVIKSKVKRPLAMRSMKKHQEIEEFFRTGEFPVGQSKYTACEEELEVIRQKLINKKKVFGIFEVDMITNKKLVQAVLPRREGLSLKWDLFDIKKQKFNSVDIRRALDKGYQLTKIYSGIIWTQTAKLFDDYIQKMFKIKQESKKGTSAYTISKLLMNGLYGKQLQRPIKDTTDIIRKESQLEEIRKKKSVQNYTILDENNVIVVSQKKDLNKTVSKPSQLGSFILAYSRLIMDRYMDEIDGYTNKENQPYYTDTDAIQVNSRVDEKLKKFRGTGNLGDLDLDIKGKIVRAVYLAPKTYLCEYLIEKSVYDKMPADDQKKMLKVPNIKEDIWMGKHIRAKGISTRCIGYKDMTFETFKGQLEGDDPIKMEYPGTKLKRNLFNLPSTSEASYFSVCNKTEIKLLGKKKFDGRVFDEEYNSLPHGFDF